MEPRPDGEPPGVVRQRLDPDRPAQTVDAADTPDDEPLRV
jgi:hypothetical protein